MVQRIRLNEGYTIKLIVVQPAKRHCQLCDPFQQPQTLAPNPLAHHTKTSIPQARSITTLHPESLSLLLLHLPLLVAATVPVLLRHAAAVPNWVFPSQSLPFRWLFRLLCRLSRRHHRRSLQPAFAISPRVQSPQASCSPIVSTATSRHHWTDHCHQPHARPLAAPLAVQESSSAPASAA